MTRTTLETGGNGIQLQLEYGSLEDASTGGSITANTTSVRLSNIEAWLDTNGYHTVDSSNKLTASGGWCVDNSWSNISIDTSGSKKLAELSRQNQSCVFGKTNGSYTVSLTLTGIGTAGETLDGSRSWTVPRRPYHAPIAPGASIDATTLSCSGNQLDPYQDSFWATTDWQLETNDVWADHAMDSPGATTSVPYVSAPNSRYRHQVRGVNADAVGAFYTTGYWYTEPPAPLLLSVARAKGSTAVTVNWNGNGVAYVGYYQIFRSLNGGAYSQIATAANTPHTDTVPLGSTASYYVVTVTPTGVNTAVSANSAELAIDKGWNAPNPPVVSLVRTGETTANLVISGNQNVPTNDRYTEFTDWQLSVNGASMSGGGTVAGNVTTIPISGLALDSRIQAQAHFKNSSGGASAWVLTNYLYTKPDAPTAFTAARADASSPTVNLAWVNNADYPGTYLLDRSTDGGTTWLQAATFPGTATAGSVQQAATASAMYRLRVVSPEGNQFSDYSGSQGVAIALVSDKERMRLGGNPVDLIYVGAVRIRQVAKGATILWVDGSE